MILAQLSKIRLDKKQFYNIRDFMIRRDALSISLNRGTIAFAEPVLGKVTGAVFIGNGEVVTIPPDPIERQQLHKFTSSPILNETFTAALFRFTDDTYDAIMQELAGRAQEEVTEEETSQFIPWDTVLTDRAGLLNYRIMADLIGNRDRPLFFAELNGAKLGWFDVVFDGRLEEEVLTLKVHDRPDRPVVDLWTSFHRRSEARDPSRTSHENKSLVDILGYAIDATISADTTLECKATMRFKARAGGDRLLGFDLSRFLRVSAVSMGGGQAVPFYQHPDMTDEEIQRSGVNSVVVVLPQALRADEEVELQFSYSGDVIEKRGRGIFYVGERGLWYPNAGHQDRARFHLTFHFPPEHSLVATGQKLEEWEDGGWRHSQWDSGAEFPVAGFNYGDFTILTNADPPVPVSVCVNNDVETIYKEIAARRAFQREMNMRAAASQLSRRNPIPLDSIGVAPDFAAFSTRSLAENILAEVRATLGYFSDVFGRYPYQQLTVSQFPVNYSQGWPSLLYVSTLSFFNPEQRAKLGLRSERDFMHTELVRAHEIAHQWFGNMVGWRSYHDQWMSEGFANYAGAMYLEHKYKSAERLREILDAAREHLLAESPTGDSNEAIGPIWLGYRLSSTEAPQGYLETVYNKSTWVIHMLRMMMRGEGKQPDEPFLRMVRDFIKEFDGKVASTWDFKRIAEIHMTQAMDLEGNKTLDWFFDQWVFGTGIPAYSLEYQTQPAKGGFVISGTVRQEDVSENFIMPVPVFSQNGSRLQRLGSVLVSDDGGNFRFTVKTKPERLVIDPEGAVLARVK